MRQKNLLKKNRRLIKILGVCLVAMLSGEAGTTAAETMLWSADHETGDLSQWPAIWNSGNVRVSPVRSPARSGKYACAMRISGSAGARMAVDQIGHASLPKTAWYSAWYYFPETVNPKVYWNIMQWKRATAPYGSGSHPVYTLNVDHDDKDGSMAVYLYNHVGRDGRYNTDGEGGVAISDTPLPLRKWVHIEVFYEWSTRRNGRVTVFQDGAQVMNIENVITEFPYRTNDIRMRQWTVNNYTSGTQPASHTLYIDDAVISLQRVGVPNTLNGGAQEATD